MAVALDHASLGIHVWDLTERMIERYEKVFPLSPSLGAWLPC